MKDNLTNNQVFIFHGADSYSSLEKLKTWTKLFLTKYPESSVIKIEADEIDSNEIFSRIESISLTNSLFDETKLIIIKRIFTQKRENIIEHFSKLLNQIQKKTFILFWEPKKIEIAHPLLKNLIEKIKPNIQIFNELSNNLEFNNWLKEALKDRKIICDQSQVNTIAILLGRDLGQKNYQTYSYPSTKLQMSSYLDSIWGASFFANLETLNFQDIVYSSENPLVFELTENLIAKNLKRSLKLLDQLARQNPFEVIFSTIIWQFRVLLQLKILDNNSLDEIIGATKLSPFVVKKNLPFLNKFSLNQIYGLFDLFLQTDLKMKTGFEARWMLDNLVIQICNGC